MRHWRWFAVCVAAVVFACGKPNVIPTSPTPPPGSPPVVVNFYANGPTRIAPGEVAQFTAKALMSDGSLQDYTAQATWRSSDTSVLTIGPNGQATGVVSGEARVSASLAKFAISPSVAVTVIPQGTYRLSGVVLETDLPIAGAAVAVVSGQGTGLSTLTDSYGNYRLYGVAGAVQVEVSKAGYTPLTKTFTVSGNSVLDFRDVVQAGTPQQHAGTYALDLSANTCVPFSTPLPDEYKHRTYTAVITQDGPRLAVTLSGADFVNWNGRGNGFKGRIQPDGVRFQILADYYYYSGFDVLERLPSTQALVIFGDVTATASPSGIAGTLSGEFVIYTDTAPPKYKGGGGCYGTSQFTMTPLTARVRR